MATTDSRPLAELVKPGDVTMLATTTGAGTSSRPLTVASVQTQHLLFLVDREADWLPSLDRTGPVHATVSASGRNDWLSFNSHASLNEDRALVRELWSAAASAYFDGEDDPRIVVLDLEVIDGEYWSAAGGGPIGRLVSMVSAALGRQSGTHGELT